MTCELADLATTLICAVAVSFPTGEVRVTVLVFNPVVVPSIFTEKLHTELAATVVAPVNVILAKLGTAESVPPEKEPEEHVIAVKPFGLATTRPEGNVSIKKTLLIEEELGLEKVKGQLRGISR